MKILPCKRECCEGELWNHHLGLQTQTWEEAEHKDWPQCSTQGWEEPIQDVGITTYPHKWLLSKFPELEADQDSEDQAATKDLSHPHLKHRNPLSYITSTSSPYPS